MRVSPWTINRYSRDCGADEGHPLAFEPPAQRGSSESWGIACLAVVELAVPLTWRPSDRREPPAGLRFDSLFHTRYRGQGSRLWNRPRPDFPATTTQAEITSPDFGACPRWSPISATRPVGAMLKSSPLTSATRISAAPMPGRAHVVRLARCPPSRANQSGLGRARLGGLTYAAIPASRSRRIVGTKMGVR